MYSSSNTLKKNLVYQNVYDMNRKYIFQSINLCKNKVKVDKIWILIFILVIFVVFLISFRVVTRGLTGGGAVTLCGW